MLRYNKLLAGASWMGEYGNPDVPEDREFIEKYSPYQNLDEDQEYPKVLFYTSTLDDRVHPGHARKMAAKMENMGQEFFYYENIEGGHGGTANQEQLVVARRWRVRSTLASVRIAREPATGLRRLFCDSGRPD